MAEPTSVYATPRSSLARSDVVDGKPGDTVEAMTPTSLASSLYTGEPTTPSPPASPLPAAGPPLYTVRVRVPAELPSSGPVFFAVTVKQSGANNEWVVDRRYSAFEALKTELWWKQIAKAVSPDLFPPKFPPPNFDAEASASTRQWPRRRPRHCRCSHSRRSRRFPPRLRPCAGHPQRWPPPALATPSVCDAHPLPTQLNSRVPRVTPASPPSRAQKLDERAAMLEIWSAKLLMQPQALLTPSVIALFGLEPPRNAPSELEEEMAFARAALVRLQAASRGYLARTSSADLIASAARAASSAGPPPPTAPSASAPSRSPARLVVMVLAALLTPAAVACLAATVAPQTFVTPPPPPSDPAFGNGSGAQLAPTLQSMATTLRSAALPASLGLSKLALPTTLSLSQLQGLPQITLLLRSPSAFATAIAAWYAPPPSVPAPQAKPPPALRLAAKPFVAVAQGVGKLANALRRPFRGGARKSRNSATP